MSHTSIFSQGQKVQITAKELMSFGLGFALVSLSFHLLAIAYTPRTSTNETIASIIPFLTDIPLLLSINSFILIVLFLNLWGWSDRFWPWTKTDLLRVNLLFISVTTLVELPMIAIIRELGFLHTHYSQYNSFFVGKFLINLAFGLLFLGLVFVLRGHLARWVATFIAVLLVSTLMGGFIDAVESWYRIITRDKAIDYLARIKFAGDLTAFPVFTLIIFALVRCTNWQWPKGEGKVSRLFQDGFSSTSYKAASLAFFACLLVAASTFLFYDNKTHSLTRIIESRPPMLASLVMLFFTGLYILVRIRGTQLGERDSNAHKLMLARYGLLMIAAFCAWFFIIALFSTSRNILPDLMAVMSGKRSQIQFLMIIALLMIPLVFWLAGRVTRPGVLLWQVLLISVPLLCIGAFLILNIFRLSQRYSSFIRGEFLLLFICLIIPLATLYWLWRGFYDVRKETRS